ncbi:FecR family protein [Pseudomonas abieticivorans]|uniref:FecR family protein n=1 Tax=Pseudomonas abieticivorans TaxID=2931382 RepID=UPI0020BD69FB|nr:FecR family protein [Pseudomonas sp. PIA16]
MSAPRVDELTLQAIDWLLRLEAKDPHHLQAFNQWLASSEAHRQAWQRVTGLLQQPMADLQAVEARSPGQLNAARQALNAPRSAQRRALLGGGLAAVLLGVTGGALVERVTPLSGLLADLSTATGERKTVELPDGSRLSLNARSAVDIRFNGQRREVRLLQGEVQVDVAPDPQRPFIIATEQGEVRALGTRFLVRQDDGGSLASVQQHSVQLTTRNGQQRRIETGEAVWFSAEAIRPLPNSVATQADWRDGRIDIRDEPLGQLIEALRPYCTGILRVSPAAARLRVYGVYPLDDSARTLQSLADTFPISVRRYGPWLTLIDTTTPP